MTQTPLFDPTTLALGNRAYTNYTTHLDEINRVRQGIEQNKKGLLPLTDITQNQERLNWRMAREGAMPERLALERINGVPNFQDLAIVRKIVRASTSVCRIVLRGRSGIVGYGTGCLVAPNVLITNNHVLPDADTASRALAQFNYELGDGGQPLNPVTFALRPDLFFLTSTYTQAADLPFSGRDFTLVAVEPANPEGASLNQFGFIRLDSSMGKIIEGENCVVIQHPKGDYKKIVIKDTRLLTFTDNFLIYEADTLPGSSGSLVMGLGTGEAVALHHSAVPRKDANGNWLRKDGHPSQPTDTDDDIDWIGNEGVRVSCIVDAFNNLSIPDTMQPIRSLIVAAQTPSLLVPSSTPAMPAATTPIRTEAASSVGAAPTSVSPVTTDVQYFEVLLVPNPGLQADWVKRAGELIPGFVTEAPLLPASLDSFARRMRYLTVRSAIAPWTLAATIEALPQVESCRPDLETLTDVGRNPDNGPLPARATESALDFIVDDGTSKPNEDDFLKKWGQSVQVLAALKNGQKQQQQRWWHWSAINWPATGAVLPGLTQKDLDHLARLKLVQFDTGYTDHSKVAGGYDLTADFDFIDQDEDARDGEARIFFKMPDHGTRTASLVMGGSLAGQPPIDGNDGILAPLGKRLIRLIPYRVAQSVLLIGRAKQVVDAVNNAIRTGADVAFMCMGSYPRPMFEAIAREAYEKGLIWVCAAGNEVQLVVAPAIYPGTIAVAATNANDQPWDGSSHDDSGNTVDIAAPGEQIYVPGVDKDGREIMSYGNGTSYATPQVAAAAMLWKAKNADALRDYMPWQVVEAFRTTLQDSARNKIIDLDDKTGKLKPFPKGYGKGILDIQALLSAPLPAAEKLKHAYNDKPDPRPAGNGIAEAAHWVWNVLRRKVGGTESTLTTEVLTPGGQQAMAAFAQPVALGMRESSTTQVDSEALLRYYFQQ